MTETRTESLHREMVAINNRLAAEAAEAYVTQIWCPPADDGVQRLHAPMREPEPEPEIDMTTPEPQAAPATDLELSLMSAELASGIPVPDACEASDLAIWRAEHARELALSPAELRAEIEAEEALLKSEAEAELEAGL